MTDNTPRLGLNSYEQGDENWSHTDLVDWVDEHGIDSGTAAERPGTGEYDGEPYLALDQRILWRWDADANDWSAVAGLGSEGDPLPETLWSSDRIIALGSDDGLMSEQDGKVIGEIDAEDVAGLVGVNLSETGEVIGVYGESHSDDGYGLYTPDDAHVGGELGAESVDATSVSAERVENVADYIISTASEWNDVIPGLNDGEVVYVGDGTLSQADAVDITADNVTISGAGQYATTVELADGEDSNIVTVSGDGVTIRDIAFDGNHTEQSTGSGIAVQGDDVTCERVYVVDAYRHAFTSQANATNTVFSTCHADNYGDDGFEVSGDGGENKVPFGCRIFNVLGENGRSSVGSSHAVEIDDRSEGTLVMGAYSYNNAGGGFDLVNIDQPGGEDYSAELVLAMGLFSFEDGGRPVRIGGDRGRILVNGVYAYQSVQGVVINSDDERMEKVQISNCVFDNCEPSGIEPVAIVRVEGCEKATLSDIDVYTDAYSQSDLDGPTYGCLVRNSGDVNISNMNIYDYPHRAIQIEDNVNDAELVDCRVKGAEGYGMRIRSPTRLINCSVEIDAGDDSTTGLRLEDSADGTVIDGGEWDVSADFDAIWIDDTGGHTITGVEFPQDELRLEGSGGHIIQWNDPPQPVDVTTKLAEVAGNLGYHDTDEYAYYDGTGWVAFDTTAL